MVFQSPWALLLIALIPAAFYLHKRHRGNQGLRFSNSGLVAGLPDTFKMKMSRHLAFLKLLALLLIILALARPQAITEETTIIREGIDIMLSIDLSTSMLAEDLKMDTKRKNRIETAKEVIDQFVRLRQNDRIGMVAFALRPYTICPLTFDHAWLRRSIARLEVGMIEDGTAIGTGLIAAMNKIKNIGGGEKIIILLTDGRNNAGDIPPLVAAEAAKALKIKVYTIGIGSRGTALYPVLDPLGKTIYRPVEVDLDEKTLQSMASQTGAAYFRATDAAGLEKIYREIDRLEKRRIEEKIYYTYRELYPWFVASAILLLLLALLLESTLLRRIP